MLTGNAWSVLLPLLLQLPLATMMFMQPVLVAINVALVPPTCAAGQHASAGLAPCAMGTAALVTARAVILPLAVVWVVEARARRAFLAAESRGQQQEQLLQ